ncbi:MAG: ferritin [Marinifilaceae bacterium]|jgi:ferritin
MIINKKVEKVLNKQINMEFWSAYLYLSMSNYLFDAGFHGFAHWFQVQFKEEAAHALKMLNYVNERGGRVILTQVPEVPKEWKGVMDVYEETYKHECEVTKLINECVDVANKEKDHATKIFLNWFVTEQVEEEATVSEIIDQLKMFNAQGEGLYLMDKSMRSRTAGE